MERYREIYIVRYSEIYIEILYGKSMVQPRSSRVVTMKMSGNIPGRPSTAAVSMDISALSASASHSEENKIKVISC